MTEKTRATVLSIYDTVADPTRWPDVLSHIAQQIDARGCIVFEWQQQDGARRLNAPHHSNYYARDTLDQYLLKCFEFEAVDQDIFEAHSLQTDGIDLIDDSLLAPSIAELKKRKNVEILQKFGLLHRAAGLLSKDNRSCSRFSVQFGSDRGGITSKERAHLAELLPHVAKALDLGRPVQQLARSQQSMLAAMDRLNIGLCILDRSGRIVESNEEFKRQAAAYPVIVTRADGRLRLFRDADQARFETLISDTLNHGKFGARPRKEAISTKGDQFLCLEVATLWSSAEFGTTPLEGYILFTTDTSRPITCNPQPIRQAYGLTDAEFALVEAIAQGLTNAQIAERRGRSVATINAQVKSILSKTHCSNRTQFVRLMMSFGVDFLNSSNGSPDP